MKGAAWIRDLSIRGKLAWVTTLSTGIALIVACAAFLAYDVVTFRQTLARNLATRAEILAYNSASAVIFRDREAAETTLAALRVDPHVIAAEIVTPDGARFAGYPSTEDGIRPALSASFGPVDKEEFREGKLLLVRGIFSEGSPIARLAIESDLTEVNERIVRYTGIVVTVLIASLLIALVVLSRLQRTISRPILQLAETARIVSRDRNYGIRATLETRDEVGTLVTGFNQMLAEIQRRDAELQNARDELEKRVQERTRELARSNSELEQFAYVASHDLQEPLRMVGSYTQLLARRYQGRLDSDADDFIAYAVDGVSRMQTLINDLLTFSRVGTRGKPFERTSTEEVLEQVLGGLSAAIGEAGAVVTHDPLPAVIGDRSQLVQLFQNLIANAIKFRGEAKPTVHVKAERLNGSYEFSVIDNGIGIDPEYHERIFVIFQRLHGRGRYPGTGIGLAICKKIVERHGGQIRVESASGRGCTFRFTLPAAKEGDPG